ncbi:MAG: hypothetical protein HKO14_05710 [Silicimonas sp.]|nr:hypothetical protein [Silicimonas sp.]RZW07906.1 MAG: hypothetical protein EX266_06015 [Paracoccaceae bacterium]
MARSTDSIDPKGLIRESYRIDGIAAPECRSIFLDWAISVPLGQDSTDLIRQLLTRYGDDNPDHPMTRVLTDALGPQTGGVRRGGARARRTPAGQ